MNNPHQLLLDLEKQCDQYERINCFDDFLEQQFFPSLENSKLLWEYCKSKLFSEKEVFEDPEFVAVFEETFFFIQKLVKTIESELGRKDREKYNDFFIHNKCFSIKHIEAVGLYVFLKEPIVSAQNTNFGDAFDAICYILKNLYDKDWYLDFKAVVKSKDKPQFINATLGFNDELCLRETEFNRIDTEQSRKNWLGSLGVVITFLEALITYIDDYTLSRVTKNDVETLYNLAEKKMPKIFRRYICEINDYYKDLRSCYVNMQIMNSGRGEFYSKFDKIENESNYYTWSGRGGLDKITNEKNHIQKCYLGVMSDLKKHFPAVHSSKLQVGDESTISNESTEYDFAQNEVPIVLGAMNIQFFKGSGILLNLKTKEKIKLDYPKDKMFWFFLSQGVSRRGRISKNTGEIRKEISFEEIKNQKYQPIRGNKDCYSRNTLLKLLGELRRLKVFPNVIFIVGDVRKGFYLNTHLLPETLP